MIQSNVFVSAQFLWFSVQLFGLVGGWLRLFVTFSSHSSHWCTNLYVSYETYYGKKLAKSTFAANFVDSGGLRPTEVGWFTHETRTMSHSFAECGASQSGRVPNNVPAHSARGGRQTLPYRRFHDRQGSLPPFCAAGHDLFTWICGGKMRHDNSHAVRISIASCYRTVRMDVLNTMIQQIHKCDLTWQTSMAHGPSSSELVMRRFIWEPSANILVESISSPQLLPSKAAADYTEVWSAIQRKLYSILLVP